jgi:acetoin utilization deacetylase AcuC-like enzyme
MEHLAFAVVPSPSHNDPPHPEHPRRLQGLAEAAAGTFGDSLIALEVAEAPEEAVLAVHDPAHLDFLRRACAQAPAIIDYAPTFVSPESSGCAFRAAGATLEVLRAVVDGKARRGFAAVRHQPPRHFAQAMGFCLFNNIAIAARAAQRSGLERVMIVDFDVHHGNGTQEIFEDDPTVLYLSTHQRGIYPGSGDLEERGVGAGTGYSVNVPLPAYAGDEAFSQIFGEIVPALARRFRPEILLVSAGYDAHWVDPLANLQLTTRGFHRVSAALTELADELCAGRMVFVLEGGYDPPALREGVFASMAAGLRMAPPLDGLGAPQPVSVDISDVLRAVRGLHKLS